jgi:hypothetical protein
VAIPAAKHYDDRRNPRITGRRLATVWAVAQLKLKQDLDPVNSGNYLRTTSSRNIENSAGASAAGVYLRGANLPFAAPSGSLFLLSRQRG